MPPHLLGPLLLLMLVAVSDVWVAWDATRRRASGRDVVASVGALSVNRPEQWVLACVLLWLIAFPMYLVARRAS